MRVLLDTSICVAVLRNHLGARDRLIQSTGDDYVTSTVVAYELFVGVAKSQTPEREEVKAERLLSKLHMEVFDRSAAQAAAHVRADLERNGKSCGPYDLLIAGHAIALNLPVATYNVREFSRINGLRVEDWLA